jgi:diguanylate cyclase (GGDEF)-like protein
LLAVATEYCFTLYGNFYDFSNELGHYLRFLSVALAFIAIVLSGVHQPFELIFREMSQRRQELTELNRRLRESEAFHAGVFNSIVESVAVLDQRGIIIAVNKAWRRLAHKNGSPFLADNSVGLDYLAVCAGVDTQPGDAANQAAAGIRSVLDGSCPYFDLEYPCHSPDVQRWFHMHVSPLLGGQSGVVVAHEDVTERRTAQAIVHELAFHDPLTQLPNRRLLSDRLRQAMVASKRTGCYGAVMFLDLDNFKPLNDRYGHELGDLLLIEAAQRLRSSVRAMDTVARIGGDEFVVVLGALDPDRVESSAQALVVAEKIRSSLSTPYRLLLRQEGQDDRMVEHQCSVSIGVALFLDDETPHDRILKSADAAMYQAKDAGRNGIRFFNAPSAS